MDLDTDNALSWSDGPDCEIGLDDLLRTQSQQQDLQDYKI